MKRKREKLSDLMDRYTWIRQITDEAILHRSQVLEFQGLEQELRDLQRSLLDAYNKTKPITHPRDKGDQREEILRRFLSNHGLIPSAYGVSTTSSRMVGARGQISPELDVVIYDQNGLVTLKRYEGTLNYFPVESVHGMVQVKSRLTKKALLEGLENIRRFKSIEPMNLEQKMGGLRMASGLYRRFAILFAYEYELEWSDIADELSRFAKQHGVATMPNLVVILDRGIFRLGDDERYCIHQKDLEALSSAVIHGAPDHDGSCLLHFYLYLMGLLDGSTAGRPNIDQYIRLPLTAGKHSYRFTWGPYTEMAVCSLHGRYLKTFTEANLEKIVAYCQGAEPINAIRAMDLSLEVDSGEAAYLKQPGQVRIYNPDHRPMRGLLSGPEGQLTFESVEVDDMAIWLPRHYLVCESLISSCPGCTKTSSKPRANKPRVGKTGPLAR